MSVYREPTPDELLSALEGKTLPEDADPALFAFGRALRDRAPSVEEPDSFFASRLKAQLASAPMSKPKLSVAAILLPIVGVVAMAAIVFALPRGGEPPAAVSVPELAGDASSALGAELTLVVGDIRWRADAAEAWQSAAEGLHIAPGSELDVPGDGRAVVTLDDGSAVRLNGKTTLAFGTLERGSVDVREDRGTAYYRVMKDPNRTFTVTTAEGTVTALGTAFAVARDADKKTLDVHCIESKVKVALVRDGTKLEKEVVAGKTLSYDATQLPDAGSKESAIDPQKIAVIPFFAWNISEDAKEGAPLGVAEPVKELAVAVESGDAATVAALSPKEPEPVAVAPAPKPAPAPAPAVGITLFGTVSGTTISVKWTASGVDLGKGVKVVWSPEPDPTYPEDHPTYVAAGTNAFTLKGLPENKTLYVRVCAYTGSGCGAYSNAVKLTTGAAKVTAQ